METLNLNHLSTGENRALREAGAIHERINRIFNRWNTSDETRDLLLACKRIRRMNARRWDLSEGFDYMECGKAGAWAKTLTFRELVRHSGPIR